MKKKLSLLLLTGLTLSTFNTAFAAATFPTASLDETGRFTMSGPTDLADGSYTIHVVDRDDPNWGFPMERLDVENQQIDYSVNLGTNNADRDIEVSYTDKMTGEKTIIYPPEDEPTSPEESKPETPGTTNPTNPTTPSDDDDDDDDSSGSGGGGGGGSSSTTVKNPNPTKYVKRDEKQTPTQNTTPNTAWTSTGSGPMVFFDVQTTDWFYNAVNYVTQNGMMVGSNGKFNPNDRLTRGMMAQILYNIEKTPAAGTASFPDVQSTDWFASACAWANASGYMTGYSNGNFGPNDPITREQLAAILYRYSGAKGYNTSATAELSGFADGSSTSAWAATSMRWAVTTGLLSGKTGNRLDPTGTATRAEVAQILMNFGTKIAQ